MRHLPPLLLLLFIALPGCATVPRPRPAAPAVATSRPPAHRHAFPDPAADRPWVAIVIDDMGDSLDQVRPFLEIPLPLSFAVLPTAAEAGFVARSLSELGRDVLAHVPMEPAEPGLPVPPGTLMTSMDAPAIRDAARLALARVPGAIGANNHMGSAFTRSYDAMRPFAQVLKSRGLFFLDSRTDPGTIAEEVAVAEGVPAIRRAVFLDHSDDPADIAGMLQALQAAARAKGCAIAIGHPRAATIEALRRFATDPGRSVDVVPVSRLVGRGCATGAAQAAPGP